MPLSDDAKLNQMADEVLAKFETLFGRHPGFRPVHAKGAMLSGTFTPSAGASDLTRAPHATRPSTPVTVRFSNSTGVPVLPDNNANADPRGFAVRFHLAEHSHTDIIAHSTDGFPARTGDEFLGFLTALATSDLAAPSDPAHPKPIELFLGSHPAALAFAQMPKPIPSSFARDTYFGVSALHFLNAKGETRFGRYRIVPVAGDDFLLAEAAKGQAANFLFDELHARVAKGAIAFKVLVQLAEAGDVVDDSTVHWPASRKLFELGTISLTQPVANDAAEQKHIIFDPIPRIDGIEPSADPLLELRAAVYLISGRRRRTA